MASQTTTRNATLPESRRGWPIQVGDRRPRKIAIGKKSEGGVRSHARKAIAEGIEREAIRQVALLAISTGGYPAAMAA